MNFVISKALVMVMAAAPIFAQEYQITLESDGEEAAVIELSIKDGMATSKMGDEIEIFDLKQQRWQHEKSGKWVTLSQCETWAKTSKEKSKKSTAKIPDEFRPFALWTLDPTFKISESDTTLTLTSGQVDYKITGKKTDADIGDFLRYSKLNAYKKAMVQRKLAPYAELQVIAELESRKFMPTSMEVTIPGVPGSPAFKMLIAAKGK